MVTHLYFVFGWFEAIKNEKKSVHLPTNIHKTLRIQKDKKNKQRKAKLVSVKTFLILLLIAQVILSNIISICSDNVT